MIINKKYCFIEGIILNLGYHDNEFLDSSINKDIGFFKENIININLFPGLYSSFCKNNIIGSELYLKDKKINDKTFFKDDNNTDKNKIELGYNHLIYKYTLGVLNIDESNDDFYITPFVDLEVEENYKDYFKKESLKYFKYYFNLNSGISKNSQISITNTVNSIRGEDIFEISSCNISGNIINNGVDSRGRAIIIAETSSDENIESFYDEQDTSIISPINTSNKKKFTYESIQINNTTYIVSKSSSEGQSITNLTNDSYYYLEDNMKIRPFREGFESLLEQDVIYSSGIDTNNENGSNRESIIFSGEIN